MTNKPNYTVKCSVYDCRNHSASGCYCALDSIEVSADNALGHSSDCRSYRKGIESQSGVESTDAFFGRCDG